MNQLGKMKNRIPGSCLLISSLPGSASKTNVESLGKPRDVNKHSSDLMSKDSLLGSASITVVEWLGKPRNVNNRSRSIA